MHPRSETSGVGFREIEAGSGALVTSRRLRSCPRPHRSDRLPALLGLESNADTVFSKLKVAVLGTGSVGRPLAFHLSRLMIHTLWLVDPGSYKASSLLTQPVLPEEIGRPKALSTAEVCKRISPDTRVWAATGRGEDLDQMALADADLILLATDNLTAEVAAGQHCLHLGIPLLQACVHGASLLAQVRFFTNCDGQGSCPACAYGDQEWDALNRQTRFSCEGGSAASWAPQILGPVTASFSFLCSLAANLAMIQLTRHVLNLGEDTGDCLTEYCGYSHKSVVSPLPRNPHCRCEHVAWKQMSPPRALSDCTLSELTRTAGIVEPSRQSLTALTVDEWEFVQAGRCDGCGRRQPIGKFHSLGEAAGTCRKCGQAVTGLPFFSQRQVSLALLATQVDQPLRLLTPTTPRWVVVQEGDQGVCFRQDTVAAEREQS